MSTIEHMIGEQNAKDGGGKWKDPVLGNYLVDGIPNNAPELRKSRVSLGTVPQKNHKVLPKLL